jgi:glycosyltransferase involved in cell wall biosynthesis
VVLRTVFSKALDLIAGGEGLFAPQCRYARPPLQAVVLAPGAIPTTDLYLKRRLEGRFGDAVRYVDVLRSSPGEADSGDDALVVIVRHAPLPWLRWLEARRPKLAGVVFLMDDDIPAAARAAELPFRYAMKTAWRYARARRLLGRICSEVWVSTAELARRYAHASPSIVEPAYLESTAEGEQAPVYFYHGTWAHRREIEWLVPVVKEVQQTLPAVWFEIMGTGRVSQLFRGIPRVRVVHPMSWPDYLAYAGSVRYQVGLAPCFDTPFNRARSHSKMFDITRLGAAGIYSNVGPYAEKIIADRTGLLCENEQDAWSAAIITLLRDEDLRRNLYHQANAWAHSS